MNATLFAFMSIGLYGLGTIYEASGHIRSQHKRNTLPLFAGLAAGFLQCVALIATLSNPNIDEFSLVNSAAIITCLIVTLFVVISFRRQTQSMLLLIYPAAIASTLALLFTDPKQGTNQLTTPILLHVSLSILAYCVLLLAAIQALLVVTRNRALKNKLEVRWLNKLPPLLTMEAILFELLRIGTLLLGGAILLGFIFVDNLFAQHLAHKTFFSLLAFTLYTALLAGHKYYGWRGGRAGSLTLWATASLMIGFFGTKFVVEAIL